MRLHADAASYELSCFNAFFSITSRLLNMILITSYYKNLTFKIYERKNIS